MYKRHEILGKTVIFINSDGGKSAGTVSFSIPHQSRQYPRHVLVKVPGEKFEQQIRVRDVLRITSGD